MNVQVVQMNPLAVYNAMYYDERLKGTTMIVDLGAENTDLIIADGETIWLRSIPIGGNNFTEVLVKSFKLKFAKAEELKRNAATSKYARQIFQAMRPVFADLVAEIQRSIGFYASVHRDSRIKKIIALGGTFRLPGLQKYLQQNLQLDVERLNDLAAGAPGRRQDGRPRSTRTCCRWSAPTGWRSRRWAMGRSPAACCPQHIRREKMWKDKTKWFGAAAATFAVGTTLALGGYYLQELGYDSARSSRDSVDSTVASAKMLDQQWNSQIQGARRRFAPEDHQHALDAGLPRDVAGAAGGHHRALPRSPAYMSGDVKAITKTPRAQRSVIFVDKIYSTYSPDLLTDLPKPIPGQWSLPGQRHADGGWRSARRVARVSGVSVCHHAQCQRV